MKLNNLLSILSDKNMPLCVNLVADNGDIHTIYNGITAKTILKYIFMFDNNLNVTEIGVGNGCLDIYLKEDSNV